MRCAATKDRTSATTRLVPKDRHWRAYALRMLREGPGEENLLVDPLPEGWHPETHGTAHGRIPLPNPFAHSLSTPEDSWVLHVAPRLSLFPVLPSLLR